MFKNKEIKLEKKRAEIEEKISELKNSKKNQIETREILKKEIESCSIEIDFLENFDNCFNVNDNFKRKIDLFSDSSRKKKNKKNPSHKDSSVELELLKISISHQVNIK